MPGKLACWVGYCLSAHPIFVVWLSETLGIIPCVSLLGSCVLGIGLRPYFSFSMGHPALHSSLSKLCSRQRQRHDPYFRCPLDRIWAGSSFQPISQSLVSCKRRRSAEPRTQARDRSRRHWGSSWFSSRMHSPYLPTLSRVAVCILT
ncbi:hypothetical protein BDP55DRAFT_294239 [Colletotrichum godetiae]|uniref:Uncharacterized protein n=1 Tax=Colletotrichum godetiae TaxID=1209918 RepID=A0AAJ0ADQ1_9PEZI|nr:uncharacterized protein BDP55DRAFT_294239 [Colletotrichum godetiae]KAK1671405.1 hypothetical protein BDP55DRAFT_294239 [Colletotrichum godetiae]